MRRAPLLLLAALPLACACPSSVVVHDVYFEVVDDSPEKVDELVAGCHEYLADLPGIARFAAGTRVPERTGGVNDEGFHVSLHVWFEDAEAYAVYDDHPRHLEFIETFRGNWASVRVFDSNATQE